MAARCRGFASSLHPYCSQESVSSPEVRMFIFWVSAPETQRGNLEIALFHETSSTTMRLASYFPRRALRKAGRRWPREARPDEELRRTRKVRALSLIAYLGAAHYPAAPRPPSPGFAGRGVVLAPCGRQC